MRRIFLRSVLLLVMFAGSVHADAIHDAARDGDLAALAAAIAAGADVNSRKGSATPLTIAVKYGHLEAAELLISRGSNVNAVTSYSGEPLMMAAIQARADLMELLLNHGAIADSTHDGQTALHVAARLGCLDCVKALVKAGTDVNALTFSSKGCLGQRTALHLARRYEYTAIADFLMAHGAVVPQPPPISEKLGEADAERGRLIFVEACAGCHAAERGAISKDGPNLWNVVGRRKAELPGIAYSSTLRAWKGVWTYEDLNRFLYGPTITTPGVAMETDGIASEELRADLIAYLRNQSEEPAPLP